MGPAVVVQGSHEGELSNGLRSSGKTEENACRQMGNSIFWSISGLGQIVKRFSHLSNVYIRFYAVYAVYGQMGTSFHHLSKLCAESGQMENSLSTARPLLKMDLCV